MPSTLQAFHQSHTVRPNLGPTPSIHFMSTELEHFVPSPTYHDLTTTWTITYQPPHGPSHINPFILVRLTMQNSPQINHSIKHSIKPHNKVRTGCVTCRRRRVKCDESKPTCMRCRRGQHDCAGYDTPVAWIFDPFSDLDGAATKTNLLCRSTDKPLTIIEFQRPPKPNPTTTAPIQIRRKSKLSSSSSSSSRRSTSHPPWCTASTSDTNSSPPRIPRSLSTVRDWRSEETSRFQFYMTICRSTLECAFDSDVDLFCTILPQASYQVPAIRAALVCFASYTESLMDIDPQRRRVHRQFAERQYGKVLQAAASIGGSQRSESDWLEVFLVALLLRCIETYRHDYVRAATHLVGSARIVTEKGGSNHFQNPSLALENSIKQIISRVDAKVRLGSVQPDLAAKSPMSPFAQFNLVVSKICKKLTSLRSGLEVKGDTRKVIQHCVDKLDHYFSCSQLTGGPPDDMAESSSSSSSSSSTYLQVQYEICRLVLLGLADEHDTSQSLPSSSSTSSTTSRSRSPLPLPPSTITTPPLSSSSSTPTSSTTPQSPHQHILDLLTSFARLQHPDPFSQATPRYQGRPIHLGFGTEIVPSALFVATESPDKATRSSAISFLRSTYRQEWLWDSFNAACIAEWLVASENTTEDDLKVRPTHDDAADGDGNNGDMSHKDTPPTSSSSASASASSSTRPRLKPKPISATFYVPCDSEVSHDDSHHSHHSHTTSTSTSTSKSGSETTFQRATWIQLKMRMGGCDDDNMTSHWLNSDRVTGCPSLDSSSQGNDKDEDDDDKRSRSRFSIKRPEEKTLGTHSHVEPRNPHPRYSVPGPFWPSAAQAIWNAFYGAGDSCGERV